MDGEPRHGLFHGRDLADGRQRRRAADVDGLALLGVDPVDDGRRRGDEVEVVLALEALLHDLHVKQAQEAQPEAEPQGIADLGVDGDGGVVEAQLVDGVAQVLVVAAVYRVDAREDHGLGLLEARERLGSPAHYVGDRVSDAGIGEQLDGGDQEADVACDQVLLGERRGREHTELGDLVLGPGGHEGDLVAYRDATVDHPHQDDHAHVAVEPAVDDEGLQGQVEVAFWGRDVGHDGLEHLVDAEARLGRAHHRVVDLEADGVFDLLEDLFGAGAG